MFLAKEQDACLVDVFTVGTVSTETTGAWSTLPGAVRRAVAVHPAEARVRETPVCKGFKTVTSEPTESQNTLHVFKTLSVL